MAQFIAPDYSVKLQAPLLDECHSECSEESAARRAILRCTQNDRLQDEKLDKVNAPAGARTTRRPQARREPIYRAPQTLS